MIVDMAGDEGMLAEKVLVTLQLVLFSFLSARPPVLNFYLVSIIQLFVFEINLQKLIFDQF